MTLYKEKHRIEPARMSGWDYASPGYYFVSICVNDRANLFGEIADGAVALNEYGRMMKKM